MRDGLLRATWRVAVAVVVPGAGYLFVACGGGGGAGGASASDASQGSDQGSEGAVVDTGGPETGDSSVPHDASHPEGGDAEGAADGGEAGDAGGDSGLDFDAGDCGLGSRGEPLDLSCTGLYSDWSSKTVATGVQPYDPGLHLWSDGAGKSRWIYLPAGTQIDTSNMDEWTFPVGTKIWKEFSLPIGDASTTTRIETRMLWKWTSTSWYRTTYRWSDDGQSSAVELTTGQQDAGGTGFEIPTQFQCNECHNGRMDGVLGFEAVSLSSPGASGMTLQTLKTQGLLTAPPATPYVIPGDATETAALGWLHTNCGISCHNSGNGQAVGTGFWMRLDVATLASVQTTNTYTTGWNQQTQGFQIPDAATTYRLSACDTTSSCAYYRADHRNGFAGTPPGTQMPPLATHLVDTADMAALKAWIDEGCDGGM